MERGGRFLFLVYLFGLLTFSGGLSLLGEWESSRKGIYGPIHFGLIVFSILSSPRLSDYWRNRGVRLPARGSDQLFQRFVQLYHSLDVHWHSLSRRWRALFAP